MKGGKRKNTSTSSLSLLLFFKTIHSMSFALWDKMRYLSSLDELGVATVKVIDYYEPFHPALIFHHRNNSASTSNSRELGSNHRTRDNVSHRAVALVHGTIDTFESWEGPCLKTGWILVERLYVCSFFIIILLWISIHWWGLGFQG